MGIILLLRLLSVMDIFERFICSYIMTNSPLCGAYEDISQENKELSGFISANNVLINTRNISNERQIRRL